MNFELPIAVERITSAVAGKECKSPPELDQAGFVKIIPATSYSPTQLPAQYHRLQQA